MANRLVYRLPETADSRFGAVRKHDIHTGVDIHCESGTEVPALESGRVIQCGQFTGPEVDSPWWNSTDYVAIKGASGVIVYGEIKSELRVGDFVTSDQIIGTVIQVLKTDKGRPTSMLHLELYNYLFKEPEVWVPGLYRPESLENPETLLRIKRLDFDATSHRQALRYMRTRSYQLLISGWKLTEMEPEAYGLRCTYVRDGHERDAFYLYKYARGQGILPEEQWKRKRTIITLRDCKIADYLSRKEIPYICEWSICDTEEYKAIETVYGDRQAKRSGVFYMQHIDEGLRILELLGADLATKQAFCLHPLFQSDADLLESVKAIDMTRFNPLAVAYAMEYRHYANAYLAHRKIDSIDEIQMSPLEPVRHMLIADKIQNYKDLQLHNRNHHNYEALDQYFLNWHRKLGIEPNAHQALEEFAAIDRFFAVL